MPWWDGLSQSCVASPIFSGGLIILKDSIEEPLLKTNGSRPYNSAAYEEYRINPLSTG